MQIADRHDRLTADDARHSRRFRVRLLVPATAAGGAGGDAGAVVIYDLSSSGFLVDAVPQCGIGDTLRIDVPGSGEVAATIVREVDGMFGCAFVTPLSPAALAVARQASAVVWPEFGARGDLSGPVPTTEEDALPPLWLDLVEERPDRWPLPARAALAIGGAAALWGLVALALG